MGTKGSRLQYYSESALEPGAASMSGRVKATMVGYPRLPMKITDPAAERLLTTQALRRRLTIDPFHRGTIVKENYSGSNQLKRADFYYGDL